MKKRINRKINRSRESRKNEAPRLYGRDIFLLRRYAASNKFWAVAVRARNFCKENPIVFVGLLLFVGFVFLVQEKRTINISSSGNLAAQVLDTEAQVASSTAVSPISGLVCQDYDRRPIAVMLANDPVTRPLSGLKDADMVFEMQVVQDSITRLMAVYVCGNPKELGSIRSARHSFIPLAMGMDAIYAHWGGSYFALDKLNVGITDNIDALRNPFNAFYRTSNIAAPHNGFSSMERLVNSATKLGYRLKNSFEGYKHLSVASDWRPPAGEQTIKISYAYPYSVEYRYDPEKNSYSRRRGGMPEIDKTSGRQVEAKNVVIMRAASEELEDQYNQVEVEGRGKTTIYRNGEAINGTWSKDKKVQKSKLYFFDDKGNEIEFVPGQIWVEIIEPGKSVTWELGTRN